MANQQHVLIVQEGREALAAWVAANPDQRLDLTGADLSGVDLSGADLRGTNLTRINLCTARLQGLT